MVEATRSTIFCTRIARAALGYVPREEFASAPYSNARDEIRMRDRRHSEVAEWARATIAPKLLAVWLADSPDG